MDKAHPVTQFLLHYGYWIRGIVLGLIFCAMLKTGFLSLSEARLDADYTTLYFGAFMMGILGPIAGQWLFAPFWQKITPITDKVTYLEDEIVFAGSALLGVSAALFFWCMIPIFEAIRITLWALLAALPAFFLIWLKKSTLSPLKYQDKSEAVAAVQNFRDETPYFWNNLIAYVATALISALVLTIILFLIISLRGGTFALRAQCITFTSLLVLNIISAPFYVWIGRKVRPRDTESKGIHFTLGAISSLTLIVLFNIPKIFENSIDLDSILRAWPFAASYCVIVMSYIGGGFTFSKLYKPRPPALEFV